MRRRKDKKELAVSFHLRIMEISRLFDLRYPIAKKVFNRAREIDREELGMNYLDETRVRTSTVLKVLGISKGDLSQWEKRLSDS